MEKPPVNEGDGNFILHLVRALELCRVKKIVSIYDERSHKIVVTFRSFS